MVGLTPVDCNKTNVVSGTVTSIEFNDNTQDVIISIKDNRSQFYISRVVNQFDFQEFKGHILNKNIKIEMANHWSLLDPYSTKQAVCQIELNNQLIFP